MEPIYSDILRAVAAWAIGFVVNILATHHVITADQSASLTTDLMHKVVLYSPTLIPLGWAVWRIVKNRTKLLVALMPGVHTEDQVRAILKSGAPTPALTTPSNTVPGVPQ